MTAFTCGELCSLFCCPPCPAQIASKLAFIPPEPTYGITSNDTGNKYLLKLNERAEWQYSNVELENIEVSFAQTQRGNRIACMHVKCTDEESKSKYTLLYSHGNAVDIGLMSTFFIWLSHRLQMDIFSYDYSGYGSSGGQPTELDVYADIDAAFEVLLQKYDISSENIVLYGQSIGTVPTIELAMNKECAAVILHSPLMSGLRVAFPRTKRTWFFDAFPSIEKISKVTAPVLVIHGTEDEVINFSHGVAIYNQCSQPVEPLWVEGAGHNDIELRSEYVDRLRQFFDVELP